MNHEPTLMSNAIIIWNQSQSQGTCDILDLTGAISSGTCPGKARHHGNRGHTFQTGCSEQPLSSSLNGQSRKDCYFQQENIN